ncbi:MAG: redoxin family protein [Alphaproteobacteria bacterium]|jgi:cytochrome c biogenesis protein CcmG/thiol:disulfide interchange protein DsbE|nr:redoxin family protein [Thalassospira sp.]MCE2964980.1 redoxin family protein [Alphaproteobacteria bacterium]
MKNNVLLYILVAAAGLLIGVFLYALTDQKTQTPPLASVPEFQIPYLNDTNTQLNRQTLLDGTPRVVNFFASWCAPCIVELPQLRALQSKGIPIVGIAFQDTPENITAFVNKHDKAYSIVAIDGKGAASIGWGLLGVPETFVTDGNGNITWHFRGALLPEHLPEIEAALGR